MATTTSTDNTGFLDYIAPLFELDTGIKLEWVAVGTGKALELGKNCDVDIILAHDPDAEERFIASNYGVDIKKVMYNDFVLIGPKNDPAGIRGRSIDEALRLIASRKTPFVSRGDKSGTHERELTLWKSAIYKVPDEESWYIQTGQGMISTINIAEELMAYTLADRGTYIKYEFGRGINLLLVVLVEGDKALRNQYRVMAVNPERCRNVKYELSEKFIEWIVSPYTQRLIGDFKLNGKQLFVPNAGEE